jgi:hypothetical protein
VSAEEKASVSGFGCLYLCKATTLLDIDVFLGSSDLLFFLRENTSGGIQ